MKLSLLTILALLEVSKGDDYLRRGSPKNPTYTIDLTSKNIPDESEDPSISREYDDQGNVTDTSTGLVTAGTSSAQRRLAYSPAGYNVETSTKVATKAWVSVAASSAVASIPVAGIVVNMLIDLYWPTPEKPKFNVWDAIKEQVLR